MYVCLCFHFEAYQIKKMCVCLCFQFEAYQIKNMCVCLCFQFEAYQMYIKKSLCSSVCVGGEGGGARNLSVSQGGASLEKFDLVHNFLSYSSLKSLSSLCNCKIICCSSSVDSFNRTISSANLRLFRNSTFIWISYFCHSRFLKTYSKITLNSLWKIVLPCWPFYIGILPLTLCSFIVACFPYGHLISWNICPLPTVSWELS